MTSRVGLYDRSRRVIDDAASICADSSRLVAASSLERSRSRQLRYMSVNLRSRDPAVRILSPPPPPRPGEPTSFLIRGVVDGEITTARWERHTGLFCSPTVLARAEIVVAMDETFNGFDELPRLQAALDGGPTALLLTVLRAFSKVLSVDVAVHPRRPPDEPTVGEISNDG